MRRVVKLGGSLLGRKDLRSRLPQRLADSDRRTSRADEVLVLVGGGTMVDAVRELDAANHADPTEIHWLCVDLMQKTLQLVHLWFPTWHVIGTQGQLAERCARGFASDVPSLICPSSFYHRDAASELPTDWRTTSDSIAVQLAIEVQADEVLLLKSCVIDESKSIDEMANEGIVDEALPQIAKRVPRLRIRQF